jgi:hypothetical protein
MPASLYSFESARELLLGPSSPTLKALDRMLGAALLVAGPVGALTGQPWMLLSWGWVDQKNELVTRLGDAIGAGRRRLATTRGRNRHEVLVATHTVLVVAAYFEALRAVLGSGYDALEVTDEEKHRLAAEETVSYLYQSDVLVPWAGRGFADNINQQVEPFYDRLTRRCFKFFEGLAAWPDTRRELRKEVVAAAIDRYRSEYAILAAEIPEFAIWTMLGEHNATQSALVRLGELVAQFGDAPRTGVLRTLAALNESVLDEAMAELGGVTEIRSPTVRDGYIEPGFRYALMDEAARPSEEYWWSQQPVGEDLSIFLAAYFASPAALKRPLVILGQPGAGKSLLTRVCAARLSVTDAFTVVRIPLRDVPHPGTGVFQQVEDVLHSGSHGRVGWAELCAASQDRTRVVFLDGLDELMQATGATESRYLRDVIDFQRIEAAAGGPVAVVVTSRTAVADLAAIPPGCLVIKLEDFSDERVHAWVERWNEVNTANPANAAALLKYGDLIRQPLLLLLVAVIAAERELPTSADSAGLYKALLDNFVDRELDKPDTVAAELPRELRKESEFWRLGLIAFGMVNRGRQYLHQEDLLEDLAAIPGPVAPGQRRPRDVNRVLDPARRVVGRFFFVHTAEAEGGAAGRSYEFLHATFADYLIAHHILDQLRDLRTSFERPASQLWDDDLLFALISHRVLGVGGSRSLDLFAELAAEETEIIDVLDQLIGSAQERWERGRYGRYDPSKSAYIRRMAAYTANLLLLRTAIQIEPLPLNSIYPTGDGDGDDREGCWAELVDLWQAALSWSELREIVQRMHLVTDNGSHVAAGRGLAAEYVDQVSLLAGHDERAWMRAAGSGLVENWVFHGPPTTSGPILGTWLMTWLARGGNDFAGLRIVLEQIEESAGTELHRLALICLERCATHLPYASVLQIVRRAVPIDLGPGHGEIIASIVAQVPRLLVDHPPIVRAITLEDLSQDRPAIIATLLTLGSLVDDPDAGRIAEHFSAFLMPPDQVAAERAAIQNLTAEMARGLLRPLTQEVLHRTLGGSREAGVSPRFGESRSGNEVAPGGTDV